MYLPVYLDFAITLIGTASLAIERHKVLSSSCSSGPELQCSMLRAPGACVLALLYCSQPQPVHHLITGQTCLCVGWLL